MTLRSNGAYRSDCNDLFAVNPLRRSAWIVSISWAMILVPALLLEGSLQSLLLIAFGWIAATGIIMCTPLEHGRAGDPRNPPGGEHLALPALAGTWLPRRRAAIEGITGRDLAPVP